MKKVLVLYGTRYGTTKGISDEIEKLIKEKGIATESYNLKENPLKKIPPLKNYNGVLLGTGIMMGRWTKAFKNFVKKRKSEINEIQDNIGFYVCCGEASEKSKINTAINKYITLKLEDLGLNPALVDAFGGAYDLTEGSAITGMMRKIVIGIMKDEYGVPDPEGKLHDFRDWDQIKDFAVKFSNLIEK
jgi:menaquinone-dependent protoporphyrinogen IX oxidase